MSAKQNIDAEVSECEREAASNICHETSSDSCSSEFEVQVVIEKEDGTPMKKDERNNLVGQPDLLNPPWRSRSKEHGKSRKDLPCAGTLCAPSEEPQKKLKNDGGKEAVGSELHNEKKEKGRKANLTEVESLPTEPKIGAKQAVAVQELKTSVHDLNTAIVKRQGVCPPHGSWPPLNVRPASQDTHPPHGQCAALKDMQDYGTRYESNYRQTYQPPFPNPPWEWDQYSQRYKQVQRSTLVMCFFKNGRWTPYRCCAGAEFQGCA